MQAAHIIRDRTAQAQPQRCPVASGLSRVMEAMLTDIHNTCCPVPCLQYVLSGLLVYPNSLSFPIMKVRKTAVGGRVSRGILECECSRAAAPALEMRA